MVTVHSEEVGAMETNRWTRGDREREGQDSTTAGRKLKRGSGGDGGGEVLVETQD